MKTLSDETLLPAWDDLVHDAQRSFRTVLKALSEPGLIQFMPVAIQGPAPLGSAATALALTLADFETPVWLAPEADFASTQSYLRFHCGCPLTPDPKVAAFAIVIDSLRNMTLASFAQGSPEYPDRSTTLLIQVASLTQGPVRVLSGPGIAETRKLRVEGLPDDFDAQWLENAAGFPLGVDVVFCCANAIVGLPRTTRIHV
ncbi:MAG: phosphonate C-P lyase system protein PhnH [Pseudomonadota bacterium]